VPTVQVPIAAEAVSDAAVTQLRELGYAGNPGDGTEQLLVTVIEPGCAGD